MTTETNNDPLNYLPPVLQKDLDKNLCTCMDVIKIDVINAIVNGAVTLDEVKAETYACTGAGCCEKQIERLIECLCKSRQRRRRKSVKLNKK